MRNETSMLTFENSPQKAADLRFNAAVVAMAREPGMNVSQTVEAVVVVDRAEMAGYSHHALRCPAVTTLGAISKANLAAVEDAIALHLGMKR